MSRHRIVRTMDYSDEYDGYDDVYGHSVDDDNCISPTDAQQWLYDRARGQESLSSFMATHRNIEEENEDSMNDDNEQSTHRRDSEDFQMPLLSDNDQARLNSCIDEIRTIVGETVSESRITDIILRNDFDYAKSLDAILNDNQTITTTSAVAVAAAASASASGVAGSNILPITKTIEKGIIGSKFLERKPTTIIKSHSTTTASSSSSSSSMTPVIVTTTSTDISNIRKGFGVSSPIVISPVVSGRNTPIGEFLDEKPLVKLTIKDNNIARNARELFDKDRGDEKESIHMIVIGHVDAGKSTLMGHLLVDLNEIPQRAMHKFEQESKKVGKQSFMYAWVLDETGEERARGITMDVGSSRFTTTTKCVTLLDAPGHKDFIPHMISGATQADVALLVVDATTGEFETGFEQGGQTREHALLVRSLGVNQLAVIVNKLDTVNWSQSRFDEIVLKLKIFLRQAGFRECDVTYLPCSGLTGENLVKKPTESKLTYWYNGPTLINVIDNFKTPQRSIDKPFRMSVSDIFKGTGSGFCISGRIETGTLCVNDKIFVCPLREQTVCKSIIIDDSQRTSAFAGEQATVTFTGFDVNNISIGCILCDIYNPIPIATRIQVRIVVFNVKVPITIGFPVLLHHQSLIEPANIVKLKAQLHKGTGEILKKNPRFLTNNSCGLIVLETSKPICIECFTNCKELGRIMLRVGGVTIAAGIVTEIIK